MRSLRSRLLALWLMLAVSGVVTGLLLVEFYRQSTNAQVGRAEEPAHPGKYSAGAALLWRQVVPSSCTIWPNCKAKNAENAICWLIGGRCRD